MNAGPKLPIPAELASVPQRALRDFLVQYSRLLCDQFAPGVPESRVRAFVNEVLSDAATGQARPADVVLEFKHVCRFSGCNLDDCQLCRNNPSKVCEPSTVFDKQYWVRDDGKGGQVIKARCGSEVSVQLLDRNTGQALVLPDVTVKLYVVNGQNPGPPGVADPPGGLYLADDGHALFAASSSVPDDEGGLTMEMAQDEVLGAVARLPEFTFLDKNSKFKSGGRTYKSFKLLARALRCDAATGRVSVMAQVESESFKVTTKKGYDGCRKAEYLFAHQPITDKTFATLGETTISNLKSTFEGVETVEDLMRLVQASATDPQLQSRLRDTLNMARDTDKWKKLTRMLSERVVWDDSILRLFVVPTGNRPLGLLYRANKGQVDFDGAVGLVYQPPLPTGQLRAVRTNDRSMTGCGRYVDALKQLAGTYWGLTRHPGWTLAPETPKWEHATPAAITEVFAEVLGQGDPVTGAEMHIMQLASTLQQSAAPTASAGPSQASPLRSPTPISSDNHAAAVAAVMAAAGSNGLLGVAGGEVQQGAVNPAAAGMGPSGAWMDQAGVAVGVGPLASGPGGALVSPFQGSAAMAVGSGAFAGGVAAGALGTMLPNSHAGVGSGFNMSSGLMVPPVGTSGMVLVSPGQGPSLEPSPFALPATSMHVSGRSTSNVTENTSDTGHSTPYTTQLQPTMQQLLQQQQQQQSSLQLPPRSAKSLGVPSATVTASMRLHSLGQPVPSRTVSGPTGVYQAAGSPGLGPLQQQQQQQQQQGPVLPQAGSSVYSAGGTLDASTLQGLGVMGSGAMQGAPRTQGPFATVQQPPGAPMMPLGQQQQQQAGQYVMQQQQMPVSNNTLLLQRAITEGWPAPQVKALLDNMSDEELQQLVEMHAASEAMNAAAAGGQSAAAAAAAAAGGGVAVGSGPSSTAGLQGFGSSITLSGQTMGQGGGLQGVAAGQAVAQPLQSPAMQQQQQQQGHMLPRLQQQYAAAADTSGSAMPVAAGQQQQMLPPKPVQRQNQQQQQPAGCGTGVACSAAAAGATADGSGAATGADAAAALAAMFADAGVAPDGLRAMSDVQLTGDQGGLTAGLLGLDSFTGDISSWSDLLNDLRQISSGSNPPGTGPSLTGKNSYTTDWIPELLSKYGSGRIDSDAFAAAGLPAAAAAAAGGGPVEAGQAGAAADGVSVKQQAEAQPGSSTAAAAAAAGVSGGGAGEQGAAGADAGDRGARRGKRLRSKTGQAPTAAQQQEWQALYGVDEVPNELRSISKAEAHYDSFNRHFPVARLTSKTQEVQQGAQVAHPWAPGQPLSATGVAHPAAIQPISPSSPNPFAEQQLAGSPMSLSPVVPPNSRAITTDSPQVPDVTRTVSGALDGVTPGPGLQAGPSSIGAAASVAAGVAWRSTTPPVTAPLAQTEQGAAAVESLTGLRSRSFEEALEGSLPSASGLKGILELVCSDPSPCGDGSGGGCGLSSLLASQRPEGDPSAVAAAAAADNPFSLVARESMQPPAPQQQREQLVTKDSVGRHGWISGLFRRSSSWSSKSTSKDLGSGGSGSGPSGGSHTSKDGEKSLLPSGSVLGPAGGAAAGQ